MRLQEEAFEKHLATVLKVLLVTLFWRDQKKNQWNLISETAVRKWVRFESSANRSKSNVWNAVEFEWSDATEQFSWSIWPNRTRNRTSVRRWESWGKYFFFLLRFNANTSRLNDQNMVIRFRFCWKLFCSWVILRGWVWKLFIDLTLITHGNRSMCEEKLKAKEIFVCDLNNC